MEKDSRRTLFGRSHFNCSKDWKYCTRIKLYIAILKAPTSFLSTISLNLGILTSLKLLKEIVCAPHILELHTIRVRKFGKGRNMAENAISGLLAAYSMKCVLCTRRFELKISQVSSVKLLLVTTHLFLPGTLSNSVRLYVYVWRSMKILDLKHLFSSKLQY
jgi:hypothetical protein